MELKCLIVISTFVIQWFSTPGYARDCDYLNKQTCDDCIRCGGLWCSDPNELRKCQPLSGGGDYWCQSHKEYAVYATKSTEGELFRPGYEEVLAEINVGKVNTLRITNADTVRNSRAYHKIINTTLSSDKTKIHVEIDKRSSEIKVKTKVKEGFCLPTSQKFEYGFVEVGIEGLEEKAMLKYVVPCSCGCSEKGEEGSPECNQFGRLVCGLCRCNEGRHGKKCECGPDVSPSCNGISSKMQCSGNGQCDLCKKCVCSDDKEGSQYFDKDDDCKDLATTVNDFLGCLNNKQYCLIERKCDHEVFFKKWDESLLSQVNNAGKKIWVDLRSTLPGFWGAIQDSVIYVMRKREC